MPDLTLQQIYDKVALHLNTQRKKAGVFDDEDGEFRCKYRDDQGNRCAAGALIENGYHPGLEGCASRDMAVRAALAKNGVPDDEDTTNLVAALQAMHDDLEPEHWPDRLRYIAEDRGLIPWDWQP